MSTYMNIISKERVYFRNTSDFVEIMYTYICWHSEHEYDHENGRKLHFQRQTYKKRGFSSAFQDCWNHVYELTYFDVLKTNMTMKTGANDIFKIKRIKNSIFQQFFKIIMNTRYLSEKRANLQYVAPYWSRYIAIVFYITWRYARQTKFLGIT